MPNNEGKIASVDVAYAVAMGRAVNWYTENYCISTVDTLFYVFYGYVVYCQCWYLYHMFFTVGVGYHQFKACGIIGFVKQVCAVETYR